MRRKLIAGNWKMHGSTAQTRTWVAAAQAAAQARPQVDVLVLPPLPYLALASALAAGSPLQVGAQNLALQAQGAYTGECSAAMLLDCGASHVLVGHSERRQGFGEDDELVAGKFCRALDGGLSPVLCIGETLAEREAGATLAVIRRQLAAVWAQAGAAGFARAVVAYEPVWAIGTGRTASNEQAQEVHAAIRSQIAEHDAMLACSLRILYGGSVKAANAAGLLAQSDIDGALVGGASLDPQEFAAIVAAA